MEFEVDDIVYVINSQYAYTNYKNWLKVFQRVADKNYFSNIEKKYIEGSLPAVGNKYRIIFKAPKARISPFNLETLYLIKELAPSGQIYIMSQEGLLKSFD